MKLLKKTGVFFLLFISIYQISFASQKRTIKTGHITGSAFTVGDVELDINQPLPGVSKHGYIEYQITLKNISSDNPYTVKISMPAISYSTSEAHIEEISRTVVVPPDSNVKVSLFQPPLPLRGDKLKAQILETGEQEVFPITNVSRELFNRWTKYLPCVLESPAVGREEFPFLSVDEKKGYYKGYGGLCKSGVPPRGWSENWLGYTRYDGLLLTASELKDCSPEVFQAIQKYTEAGGNLIVLGKYSPPSHWKDAYAYEKDNRIMSKDQEIDRFLAGIGTCFVIPESNISNISTDTWKLIERQVTVCKDLWEQNEGTNGSTFFPITGIESIPVRALFAIIFIYAILIGPLNIYFFTKLNKRILILASVPVLSLAACLTILLYSAFLEGWLAKGRASVFTLLDEERKQAVSFGWLALYNPLTTDRAIFSAETELNPHLIPDKYSFLGGPCRVDWTREQVFGGNWLIARLPSHFKVRKVETRRERIIVKRIDESGATIINGLGAKIVKFYLMDGKGRIFEASDVETGKDAQLLKVNNIFEKRSSDALNSILAADWLTIKTKVSAKPHLYLSENSYIAFLTDAPFLETGLSEFSINERENIVFGFLKKGIGDEN
ncbi:MAG: hypothetical protein HQM10_18230 [Candidatus Riflebacteria bacterium]|nr:hypothetical protein [Candidatus Riflebacteria bacterium]